MKSLDLHIIDITHNSIRAGATEITIEMEDSAARDLLSIKIIDNGCGMPEDMIQAINDRFYSCRKERKIGMGIALLKFHSEMCNGQFYLKSKVGVPKGDLSGCFANFICQYQDINFIIRYITDDDTFELSTAEVKEVFEGMNLNNYEIIQSLTELIHENIGS